MCFPGTFVSCQGTMDNCPQHSTALPRGVWAMGGQMQTQARQTWVGLTMACELQDELEPLEAMGCSRPLTTHPPLGAAVCIQPDEQCGGVLVTAQGGAPCE